MIQTILRDDSTMCVLLHAHRVNSIECDKNRIMTTHIRDSSPTSIMQLPECCLTCKNADLRDSHEYTSTFMVLCTGKRENGEPIAEAGPHLARDKCRKDYQPADPRQLLGGIQDRLKFYHEKFEYAIDATRAIVEGKPFFIDRQEIVNVPEYLVCEIKNIEQGIRKAVHQLGFLADFLSSAQDRTHSPSSAEAELSDLPSESIRQRLFGSP